MSGFGLTAWCRGFMMAVFGSYPEETGEGRIEAPMLLPWLLTYVFAFLGSVVLRFTAMMAFLLLTPYRWSAEHVRVGV